MNEKIIKPGIIKRIVDLTKSRNQKYSQEDVDNILSAFWDIIVQAIANGDSVNLNGYMLIETQHRAERKARNVSANKEIIVPERYRVHIKSGSKLNQAAMCYTERRLEAKNV